MMTLIALFGFGSIAMATPQQLNQQGRLLDSSGAAVTGQHDIRFRLYDDAFSGSMLWEETVAENFVNGYYAVILGGDVQNNPLSDAILAQSPLYMELALNGSILSPRQPLTATPYARLAETAANVSGGQVDAAQIMIGGTVVIDSNGAWVGPTTAVNWNDIHNVPSDIADGDDDSLASLACTTGQIPGWTGSTWACTDDNSLTESQVETFITNDAIDLHVNTTLGGLPILTEGDGDTLGGLACQDGDVAKYDSVLAQWICEVDLDSTLSEADVEQYVTNGLPAFDLSLGTTLNGQSIRTATDPTLYDLACQQDELVIYDANSGWNCANFQQMLDADGDGIMSWSDCNDNDPAILSQAYDQDCDGAMTALDCDDTDPLSNTVNTDADCDGTLTSDDCNDADSNSTTVFTDADCDGALTTDDCDDSNPNLGDAALDADCDGIISVYDCNDNDPASTTLYTDADCDGVLTGDDCDDSDANTSIPGSSANCAEISCSAILANGYSNGDGTYWINPNGNSAFEAYCDMSTDGGGWTLVGLNGTGRYTDTSTQWFSSKSYSAAITPSSSGTYGMGGHFPTVSEVMVELELGSPAQSTHKVKFDWQDNAPAGMPSGNVNDIVTNVSNAGFLTNNASGCFNGSHHFNEHFAIAWATRDCGNYEVFMIGSHYNGSHQHWEENMSYGDHDGDGYYYYFRATPSVGNSQGYTSGRVMFWVR